MIDIEKLESLAKEVTQLPWEVDDLNNIRVAPKGRPIVATIHDYEDYLPRMADAQYIVASCNSVPELIAENRTLRKQVQELEKSLIELVKIEVRLPECAVCWERDQCTNHSHGDDCLAIRYIIDTAKEAAKEDSGVR